MSDSIMRLAAEAVYNRAVTAARKRGEELAKEVIEARQSANPGTDPRVLAVIRSTFPLAAEAGAEAAIRSYVADLYESGGR